MRVAVVGGGIAGSAVAVALHKAGVKVSVHEAHPRSGADIGAFLTLAGNGMYALGQIGAAAAVAESGFPIASMRVLDADGGELAAVPLGSPLGGYRCLRRARLAAALQEEVRRRGIPLRHGARLESVAETAEGVTAVFADGSTAEAELLIGADGLRSAARAAVDPGAPGPHFAGQYVCYGYTRSGAPDAPSADITMVRGSGAAFGYLVSPEKETYWFARVPSEQALPAAEIAETTPAQWRERLLALLRPDRTPAAEIVAATGEELMVTNALHLAPGLRWRGAHGRTVLLGDAAHAASPATGQGASMALEDAVVLAKCLRETPDAVSAAERYERLRRPRVERNIEASARLTAARPQSRGPVADAQRGQDRAVSRMDEELARLLDWDTPLPGEDRAQ